MLFVVDQCMVSSGFFQRERIGYTYMGIQRGATLFMADEGGNDGCSGFSCPGLMRCRGCSLKDVLTLNNDALASSLSAFGMLQL